MIASRFRNYVVPAWQGRLITDIDRRACLELLDTIADQGKDPLPPLGRI